MAQPQTAAKPFDIAIVGETNLDLILYGLPEQMPTERELLATDFVMTLGGSSSILAHNLALLGSRVAFTTLVGEDDLGRLALERLAQAGVDLARVQHRPGRATGVTLLLPHGDRRHILTHPGVMADLSVADLDVDAIVASARHFHLSSFFLQTRLEPDLPALFAELRRRGMTVSLDTNDDPLDAWAGTLPQVLDHIDILLPNESELLRIARADSLEQALDTLKTRVPTIVVKRGAHGALVQQGSERSNIAPLTVTPVDTIGAGDSFDAGFLHAWLQGRDAQSAAQLGVITGALSTQAPGGVQAFADQQTRRRYLAFDKAFANADAG